MTVPPFDRRAHPAGLHFATWAAADGWRHRAFRWAGEGPAEVPARGSVLFASGRGDFAEKYMEAYAHWRARGWNVSGFDWRGQGGSGRIVPGLVHGHLASFDPLLDDLTRFVAEWAADAPSPRVIVGHSMGGHLVLRALAEGRVGADAVVLIAPMLDLATPRFLRVIPFLAGLFGATMRPIARDLDAGIRQRRLTGSVERFEDAEWWKAQRSELGLGAPTWGWVHAAYDSIARLRRRGVLERVTTPVLLVKARGDALVSGPAIERAARRLPNARVVRTEGAHQILREADPVRLAALAAIDGFLDQAAPAR